MSDLKEKLQRIPSSFGVYLMKSKSGQVIYVGKAKNLKSRLSSYFARQTIEEPKTRALVHDVVDFEVILVSNEIEALLLERSLIKEHKPHYNVILRDDKEYPYLRIDLNHQWPRIKKVRRRKDDGATYLGPFSYVGYLNSILELTYRIFPLIRCSEHMFATVKRPCNYYHMKRCLGPCTLPVDNGLYKDMMRSAIAFLQGKNKAVLKTLQEQMKQASENEEYEKAVHFRDQLLALKTISQAQNVVIKSERDCDAIGFCQDQSHISVHVLKIREGKIIGRDNYVLPMPLADEGVALSHFLLQYYEKSQPPAEIYVAFDLPDRHDLEKVFSTASERKVTIENPQRGQKKSLVELSITNSRYHLEESLNKRAKEKIKLETVKDRLGLDVFPFRIDCIDISNIQGTAIVASQVCFIGGKAARERYRLYNIDDARSAPDDYWAIREVVRRFFKGLREGFEPPDLLIIDGGKGQLSSALSVAREFPEYKITILSLAKDKVRHFSDQEKEHSEERIFFPGKKEPFVLREGSAEYQLLTQLRDEAHRFAISQHRKRRDKLSRESFLDHISGIGPVTKKKILAKIDDFNAFQTQSIDELVELTGVRRELIERVINFAKQGGG